MAKLIIKFINAIGEVINADPDVGDKLKVVFVPNYRVSLAEKIIPAADLSEQISLAGTEASGTGNMKFALNGALTIGTMDGANVEISQAVGEENIFIFGMRVEEVRALRNAGYNPAEFIERIPMLKRIVELIDSNFFSPGEKDIFKPLLDALQSDTYMCAADFESYCMTQMKVEALYADADAWNRCCVKNIANMGMFSSDRSIEEYAANIWHVTPCRVEMSAKRKGLKP